MLIVIVGGEKVFLDYKQVFLGDYVVNEKIFEVLGIKFDELKKDEIEFVLVVGVDCGCVVKEGEL